MKSAAAILFLLAGCATPPSGPPDDQRPAPRITSATSVALPRIGLGDTLPADAIDATLDGTRLITMVSPAQLWPAKKWVHEGIEYTLCADARNRIQYVATFSTAVRTAEGVRVGMPLAEVVKISGIRTQNWPGWGFVVLLPSGWNARFLPSETNARPQDSAVVEELFRGTLAGYGS